MNDTGEFTRLLERLRAGDPDAADSLYRLYGPYLRAAVRRHLQPQLRTRFDSLDFAQDVWASFFALSPGRYTFDTPGALLGFLRRMAYYKVLTGARRHSGRGQRAAARADHPPRSGPGPTPTPSQWAIAGEELDRLVGHLPPGYQAIVHRLREGYTLNDIARMANVSRSTVDRVVRRLKDLTGV